MNENETPSDSRVNTPAMARRFPIGAEVDPEGAGVHFRVWAPRRSKVEVVLDEGPAIVLQREPTGHFSALAPQAAGGSQYRFRLDGKGEFPDPASRFQPQGPHGPSQVVDPFRFAWTDSAWPGAHLKGQVISEIHIGTFTHEGTWNAARRELPELAATGITALEIMPVADFPGRFGWGYDGVGWFAPVAIYGSPDDFRRFVDDAHRERLAVILDVVYNHFGPDGNYLREYSEDYFTDRYINEWGDAINFDGPNSCGVRELVIANAGYWAAEYHIDGLRLDATQQIFDASPVNIMTELASSFRACAGERACFVVAENEQQDARLARPSESGGCGLDGLWNDDFHHSARVALTGRNEAYYSGYTGRAQELLSAAKYGYLYQGQWYSWQKKPRGEPALDLEPWQFVTFIQNHDQISNGSGGRRIHFLTSPGSYRAITAFLLLAPGTPLLFQGQEFAASSPFCFFADHPGELGRLVREGRLRFLSQFPSLAPPEMGAYQPDPGDRGTFQMCKIDFAERNTHAPAYRMHKDLLRLRREDDVIRTAAVTRRMVDGAVLGSESLALRYFGEPWGNDRLLLLNLGRQCEIASLPEPLIAPPVGAVWELLWSSEDPRYGGLGTPPLVRRETWHMPGHAAVVLRSAGPHIL